MHLFTQNSNPHLWLVNVGIQQDDFKAIFLALFSVAFQVLQAEVVFYPGLCPAKA